MGHRPRYLLYLLGILLLALVLPSASTQAAQPGEVLLTSSGELAAGQTLTTALYSTGPANIRLQVGGDMVTDKVTMTLSGGSTPTSWDVRSGETAWAYATLPSNGSISLRNMSSVKLAYTLTIYARGVAPTVAEGLSTWSGLSRGAGIQSTIQLDVPAAGLYRFTLDALSGSYQFNVDTNYIRKTVVTDQEPAPTDTVYYLSAGTHTFTITQNPTTPSAMTSWSVAMVEAGSGDTLPTSESTSAIGGGPFTEEWIPIQLSSAQAVNMSIAVTGAPTNSLTVELYNDATKVFTSSTAFGGETIWGNSALIAGANRLRIVTAGTNTGVLNYTITLSPVAQAPYTWNGTIYGKNTGRSSLKLTFPTAGLYRFNLSATPGRYQLLLNDHYLQKTVTAAAAADFTAFVPAGTHELTIVQDPSQTTTTWRVEATPTTETTDELPFTHTSGTLGGTSNAFTEEWIPLQIPAGQPVNVRVVTTGAASDSLKLELYNSSTKVYTSTNIYGGETVWASSALANGTNLLHITTTGSNTGQLAYQVDVNPIASIPQAWQGVANGQGLNSTIRLKAPVDGVYDVALGVSEGAGQVLIDQVAPTQADVQIASTITTTLRVELEAGLHTITFRQNTDAPRTVWQIVTTLRRTTQVLIYLPIVSR